MPAGALLCMDPLRFHCSLQGKWSVGNVMYVARGLYKCSVFRWPSSCLRSCVCCSYIHSHKYINRGIRASGIGRDSHLHQSEICFFCRIIAMPPFLISHNFWFGNMLASFTSYIQHKFFTVIALARLPVVVSSILVANGNHGTFSSCVQWQFCTKSNFDICSCFNWIVRKVLSCENYENFCVHFSLFMVVKTKTKNPIRLSKLWAFGPFIIFFITIFRFHTILGCIKLKRKKKKKMAFIDPIVGKFTVG